MDDGSETMQLASDIQMRVRTHTHVHNHFISFLYTHMCVCVPEDVLFESWGFQGIQLYMYIIVYMRVPKYEYKKNV